MTLSLIFALGALTYLSRALALVLMPDPPRGLRTILERIPAPLFASLGALSILDGDGRLISGAMLAAVIGALAAAPFRSLLLTLASGMAGYGIGLLLTR